MTAAAKQPATGMLCAAACRGNRVEKARLYKASNEGCFGVQIATNVIAEAVAAAALAKEAGATWIDINCGCPIHGKVVVSSNHGQLVSS